ncbi:hypothetical protein Cus16_1456 [Curtobacterium sp. ER1/6]|nr:hypothetical protein Cus16_1456 [Curtobacterium sp. ER1/6]
MDDAVAFRGQRTSAGWPGEGREARCSPAARLPSGGGQRTPVDRVVRPGSPCR